MSEILLAPSAEQVPYQGLSPYLEQDKDRFFGRDAERDILVDKLLANRLTLLFAASGVGKSSLLNAAVLPQLKDPYGENLTVVAYSAWFTTQGESVLEGLLAAIRAGVPNAQAYAGVASLPDLLAFCCLFTRHPLVLVLDQFEEFFRYQRGSAGFRELVEQLTRVILNKDLPVHVVISMREDFALELNAFKPKLPTLLFENYYRLERMTPETARQAIVTPLQSFGFHYEPVLLERLLADLGRREREGVRLLPHENQTRQEVIEPPYLQIVCERLWDLNKRNPDRVIRLDSYEKAGGDAGILSDFLEKALRGFSGAELAVVSKAFDFLAARHGVKMAYAPDVLAQSTGIKEAQLLPVLEKLAGAEVRILRSQERGEVLWYELYHDMFSASVERWNNAFKDKQLRRARWRNGIGLAVFTALTAVLVDGYWWVNQNYFPVDYLFQLQKFRLMDWGVLPEPLPEVVEIPLPEGEVQIGELNDDNGKALNDWLKENQVYERQNIGYPSIKATLTQPFALGKYEISYEQYDYYVWQQHQAGISLDEVVYPVGATRDNGRGQRAVTQVSQKEAIQYSEWLSKKTGEAYRLPTEVEWEYAARAGTDTAYWWDDDSQWGDAAKGSDKANCDGCASKGSQFEKSFIAPIGSFPANPWELYNTAGNVWEWTCSEWKSELSTDFTNAFAGEGSASTFRVIRGGSWLNFTVWLRSSARTGFNTATRNDNVGFRILRLSRTR